MRKTFLYLIFIFIGGSASQTFADNTEVDLSIDYKGCMDSGHPCGHPSVSYDDDEITIKSDSTIYDVGVVVKDQYGNLCTSPPRRLVQKVLLYMFPIQAATARRQRLTFITMNCIGSQRV